MFDAFSNRILKSNQQMKKPADLTLEEWNSLYPKYTMKQIAEKLQCGETTVHKWLNRAGIVATRKTEFLVVKSTKKNLVLLIRVSCVKKLANTTIVKFVEKPIT